MPHGNSSKQLLPKGCRVQFFSHLQTEADIYAPLGDIYKVVFQASTEENSNSLFIANVTTSSRIFDLFLE